MNAIAGLLLLIQVCGNTKAVIGYSPLLEIPFYVALKKDIVEEVTPFYDYTALLSQAPGVQVNSLEVGDCKSI